MLYGPKAGRKQGCFDYKRHCPDIRVDELKQTALCYACKQTVKIDRMRTLWIHQIRCARLQSVSLSAIVPFAYDNDDRDRLKAKWISRRFTADCDDDDGFAQPDCSILKSKPRTTADDRQKLLLNHPHTGCVELYRVKCTRCGKWIRLSKSQQYHLGNWFSHTKSHGHMNGVSVNRYDLSYCIQFAFGNDRLAQIAHLQRAE